MDFLLTFFSSVGLSMLTAFGIVKHLSKKLLEQQLLKDIENHKQQLNERTEKLKNELSIYANEHTVKFSRLDQKTSDIIEHLFIKITEVMQICVRLYAKTSNYIQNREKIESIEDLLLKDNDILIGYYQTTKKLSELLDHNLNYLLDNEIYLSGELFEKLRIFVMTEFDIINDFSSYNGINSKEEGTAIFDKIEKQLSDYIDSYKENLNPIKKELVNEFRKILGVT
jgi:hypothetical protein